MMIYGWLGAYLLLATVILSLPFRHKQFTAVVIAVLMFFIPIHQGLSSIEMLFGFIGYFSLSSILILASVFLRQTMRYQPLWFDTQATLIAFTPILVIVYVMTFQLNNIGIYGLGFQPLYLVIALCIYALILLAISPRFGGFNLIIAVCLCTYLTGFLGDNFWNVLVDPVLAIMVIVAWGSWMLHFGCDKLKNQRTQIS